VTRCARSIRHDFQNIAFKISFKEFNYLTECRIVSEVGRHEVGRYEDLGLMFFSTVHHSIDLFQ